MAHGSKKWIRTYDGRIKRSNDRTKKDYFGELRWWKHYGWGREPEEFCPQCKHNYKPIEAHNELYWEVDRAIRREWDDMLPDRIRDFKKKFRRWCESGYVGEQPHDPRVYTWEGWWQHRKSQEYRLPRRPIYDENTWLCPKHRHKNDMKDRMWREPYPGRQEHYTWVRKDEYRTYRAKVRQLMRKAKYEEELYDDIPSKKVNGWLD